MKKSRTQCVNECLFTCKRSGEHHDRREWPRRLSHWLTDAEVLASTNAVEAVVTVTCKADASSRWMTPAAERWCRTRTRCGRVAVASPTVTARRRSLAVRWSAAAETRTSDGVTSRYGRGTDGAERQVRGHPPPTPSSTRPADDDAASPETTQSE